MSNDPRGTMIRQGNFMRIDNALVEEVSCSSPTNRSILVSYAERRANQLVTIQTIQLNIGRNTVILNSRGQNIDVCSIREGTFVNAIFSQTMTRSIPPQANAFLVIVRQNRPMANTDVTTDRIAFIDAQNNFVYTGNPLNINSQIRFVVTRTTQITNRAGREIGIRQLRPGQLVRITHGNFQTASIPPQTNAFRIQVL